MLLWGLLALVPWLLFWLRRRTPQPIDWAAMQFLPQAGAKSSHKRRWRRWLLLLTRMALPLWLALIAATPGCPRHSTLETSTAPQSTHWILVLDVSPSMGPRSAGKSPLQMAQEHARDVVAKAANGDVFSLLTSGQKSLRTSTRQTADRDTVLRQIDRLQVGGSRFQASLACETAHRMATESPSTPPFRSIILVLSDFRDADWPDPFSQPMITPNMEFRMVPCRPLSPENARIVDLNATPQQVTSGQSTLCQVELVKDGQQSETTEVRLWVNGQSVGQKQVTLQPRVARTISFECPTTEPGILEIRAAITPSGLLVDDDRYLTVRVESAIDALCIEGTTQAGKSFLAATTPLPGLAVANINTIMGGPEELAGFDQAAVDLLVIMGVREFTIQQIRSIVAFAEQGGGILLSMGPEANTRSWAQLLNQLVDSEAFQVVETPTAGNFRLNPGNYAHPIISEFRDRPASGLLNVPIQRYYPLKSASGYLDPILQYDTTDPALAAIRSRGKGGILLTTTPWSLTGPDEIWNHWPAWWSYVPILHRSLVWLYGQSAGQPPALTGETRLLPLPTEERDPLFWIDLPEHQSSKIPRPRSPTRDTAEGRKLAVTSEIPGFARLTKQPEGGSPETVIAFNLDPQESDYRKLQMSRLERWVREVPAAQPAFNILESQRSDTFHVLALLGLAVLLFLEPWLASRLSVPRRPGTVS